MILEPRNILIKCRKLSVTKTQITLSLSVSFKGNVKCKRLKDSETQRHCLMHAPKLDSYLFKQSTYRCWAWYGVSSLWAAPCSNQKHKTNSFDNATRRHQPQNSQNGKWEWKWDNKGNWEC